MYHKRIRAKERLITRACVQEQQLDCLSLLSVLLLLLLSLQSIFLDFLSLVPRLSLIFALEYWISIIELV